MTAHRRNCPHCRQQARVIAGFVATSFLSVVAVVWFLSMLPSVQP